jgi:hypothetical protein
MELEDAEREKYIADLRWLADTLESNPTLQTPYFGAAIIGAKSKEDIAINVKAYGGHWKKGGDDSDLTLNRLINQNLSLHIYARRNDVCERVVVGKRLIPEVVLPATREQVFPEHEVEIVKWNCPVLLEETGSQYSPDTEAENDAKPSLAERQAGADMVPAIDPNPEVL